MNTWFTVKVKYIKQLDDGRLKKVTEPYLVDATNFTDAEARIYEEVGEYVRGEFVITGISKTEYADVFYYDDSDDWYKCKLTYILSDEEGGKDKKVTNNFLITASSVKEAYERIKESLQDMTVDFEVPSIMLTPIVDVLPYEPKLDDEVADIEQDHEMEDEYEHSNTEEVDDDEESDSSPEVDEEDVTFVDETED